MSRTRALGLIVAAYLLLGVAYSLVVPLAEAPDELDHYHYVQYLQQQRRFPVMAPVAADNATMEANQPPLFYLLDALLTAPFATASPSIFPLNRCFTFDPGDGGRAHFYLHAPLEGDLLAPELLAFRLARLVSVLLGGLTVLLAYRLGRQLAPERPQVGLWAAALLAFNPQFIFMTASVNNDVLTACLGALLLTLAIDAAQAPALGRFAGLGLLMGLALLTKFGLLAFWPLLFAGVLTAALARRFRLAAGGALLLGGLPLLVAGWWYLRAWRLYGDPLAWTVHLQAKGAEVLRTTPLAWTDLADFARIHFQSYWAWFGWLKIQPPGWVYLLLLGLTAAGLVGLTEALRAEVRAGGMRHLSPPRLALLLQGLAVAAIYASLLRYIQTINWSGYQGRLAYAAAGPIAALLGLGWAQLAGRRREPALRRGITAGLALLAVGCLALLAARYARPALFQPPLSWTRVCAPAENDRYVEALDAPAATPGRGDGHAAPGDPGRRRATADGGAARLGRPRPGHGHGRGQNANRRPHGHGFCPDGAGGNGAGARLAAAGRRGGRSPGGAQNCAERPGDGGGRAAAGGRLRRPAAAAGHQRQPRRGDACRRKRLAGADAHGRRLHALHPPARRPGRAAGPGRRPATGRALPDLHLGRGRSGRPAGCICATGRWRGHAARPGRL